MLSGNGRHRRPRQAPAVFVTAGATGAGLAIPLLGAGSAQAADADTWDRVAQCESGGLWSADAGNGYYGGLQLTLESWEEYGGTVYAERPDLASRSQQIAVAERILADRGPDAWPSCASDAGLTGDSVGVSPGIDLEGLLPLEPPAEESGDGAAETSGGASAGASGEADASAGTPGTDAEADADTGAEADAGAGAGRHRGEPDPHEQAHAPSDGRTDRSARGTAPEPGAADGSVHRVRPGESLASIAEAYGVRGGWSALYEANRETVGGDPDLIHPGQLLDV